MAASEKQLAKLHEKLTEVFLDALEEGDVSAATLNVIRGFLKDNEVTCQPDDVGMSELQERLNRKSRLASVTPIAREG